MEYRRSAALDRGVGLEEEILRYRETKGAGVPDDTMVLTSQSTPHPSTARWLSPSWASVPERRGGVTVGLALALMALAPLVILLRAAAIGRFVRPISDDYCQVAWVKVDGFWGLVEHYWGLNGRVGNALLATLIHLVPGAILVFPALVAAVTVAALAVLVAGLLRVNGWSAPRLAIVAVSLATACALILREQDNFYQTFLWTPGNLTHMLPWVLAAALAALAVRARSGFARALVWPGLVLGGLLLGTLTEIFSALICVQLTLFVVARVWHRRRLARSDLLALLGAASVAFGLLVLLSSPGLANRRAGASPLDLDVLRATLRIWPEVLQHSVLQPWIVVPAAAGLALGVLTGPASREAAAVPYRALLGWSGVALLISLVGGSLLTVDADVTGFGAGGPMAYPRTWLDFMAATAFCLLLLGVLLGRVLAERSLRDQGSADRAGAERTRPAPRAAAGGITLVVAVASLAVVAVGADQFARVSTVDRETRQRAQAWDAQARTIRAQIAAGAREVVYRTQPIASLSDPSWTHGRPQFSNGCAATYFGVRRLIPPPDATK